MSAANAGLGPVTIVVCNYDGVAHLPHCLDALAALRGEVAEVIVVDDASSDASLELLRERYAHVRVVARERNEGPAAVRNAGMRAAGTRWVLAVDNDAVLAPDVLELLCAAAAREPEAVLVQPRSVFAREPGRVHYDGGGFHYAGLIALRNFYRPLEEAGRCAGGAGALEVDCAVSVALLADRERVLEVGGYDERYFILFEDLDLSFRLRARGWKVLSVPGALVRHRAGTAGVSYREGPRYPRRRAFYHSRNRWRFLVKCYRPWTLACAAPGLLLYEVAWLAFALAGGNLGAWCAGKWALSRELGDVLRRRAAFQRARRVGDGGLLVGGPLTVTPSVARGAARARALRLLDACLRAWWTVARRLVP